MTARSSAGKDKIGCFDGIDRRGNPFGGWTTEGYVVRLQWDIFTIWKFLAEDIESIRCQDTGRIGIRSTL